MTILLGDRGICKGDDRPRPERNGVARHPFLPHTRGDEDTLDIGTIMLRPRKILPKSSDGAEQEFIPVTVNKIIQGQDYELIEARVRHQMILGLGHKVGKEGKGAGSTTPRMTNTKIEAMQLTNPYS